MDKSSLINYRARCKEELFRHVLPFWTEHMMDLEHGGIFGALDEDGSIYSTDKSLWLQGLLHQNPNRFRAENLPKEEITLTDAAIIVIPAM